MNHLTRFLAALLMPLFLAACASTPQEPLTLQQKLANKGYELGEQVDSIRDWNINGWNYIDDQHFVMHSGVRDRYLVTLRSRSVNLRNAQAIAFSSTASSVTDKDKVIIDAPGGLRETYFIESLYQLKRVERPAESS